MKARINSEKRYTKVVLIISCVFAIMSILAIVIMSVALNDKIEYMAQEKYLYENGVEVDANIKCYRYNGGSGPYNNTIRGFFYIEYEYIDDNNRSYTDEYRDTLRCETRAEKSEREQEIKHMITEGATMKMLIADNGLCCLTIYKESLLSNKLVIIISSILAISAIVLGLSTFGIIRQSRRIHNPHHR